MVSRIRWKRESVLCVVMLLLGVVGLPIAIYVVGDRVIGEYAPGQGLFDLVAAIWTELARLNPAAWILVLSPYLGVLLLRLAWSVWRSRPSRAGSVDEQSGGTASNW